ncbi:DegT/DnrJ/EryC1/StrS family aminotransferase [Desulfuribacillus alkaliarsenatis]|uniref:Pyridoxal phosphate-dependent aminotransferase n=1 Tax=Desulfuribacillus alkaliarsenatis TaxID=766136 RepID=A0A1E5G1Y2_9FIRM|nr:aminotransferase class I/II-fold pyridoxal phosphate-dependent enzyme [Desulfuribacillus alkaliarsenatis]OEF96836.1 pyridoxal phosphate-dependent aminotransferase [Desulfuribacillus alkaliarsenatis]
MASYERIYLSTPHMSGLEQKYIEEAFQTNWIAPLGPNVDSFEQELASYVGVKGAVAVSSGTAAIHLALRLLDVGKGDIVLCSTLTFIASANPILYMGAEPVFIDSEPNSWNMSPLALERAFKKLDIEGKLDKVKAIIVVHLYGQSADMDAIVKICERYKVPIIEDAAESLGATYISERQTQVATKQSGTIGKFGVYSFNGNKIITTSGGGMLVSDDLEALGKARYLATQAREQALHYQHSEVGYNYRMSNILAGIGRGQLQVLDERVEAKRRIFARYYDELANIEGINFMPEAEFGRCNRWLTALTINPSYIEATVPMICSALDKLNIEARPVWKPLHLQPLFKGCMYFPHASGSVSDELFFNGICLPSGSNLTTTQQEYVIKAFKNIICQPT